MLDTLSWIILIALVLYYLNNKYYWFKDLEKEFEKLAKECEENYEKDKKYLDSKSQSMHSLAKSSEKRFNNFVKYHDIYLHLKEKYAHDNSKHIKTDWISYLKAIKNNLNSYKAYGFLDDKKLLKKAGDEDYKANIVITEIEDRFKKLNI